MKKRILTLMLIVSSISLPAQKSITCKFQERDFFPQQDEGGVELHRNHASGERLGIVYASKYQDTVHVYFVSNYTFKVTDSEIYFDCKFTNFVVKYKKKKGQIKRFYDRGDRKGLPLFVGTYKVNENETLLVRQLEDNYYGDFSGSIWNIVIKKGNNIYVFNLS